MSETKKREGGGQCGAVRFEAKIDLSNVMECNCSHCEKKGFILSFTPASEFRLITGENSLTEYRFNKKEIQHLFCSTCGVQSFGLGKAPDGSEMAAVTGRCVDGADLSALNPQPVDGRSL